MAMAVLNLVCPPSFPSLAASQPQWATEAAQSLGAESPVSTSQLPPSCGPSQLLSPQPQARRQSISSFPPLKFHTPRSQKAEGANGHKTRSDRGGTGQEGHWKRQGRSRQLENRGSNGKEAAVVRGCLDSPEELRQVTSHLGAWTSSSTNWGQGA